MSTVFDFSLDKVKFRDCASMNDGFLDVVISLGKGLKPTAEVLSQQIKAP